MTIILTIVMAIIYTILGYLISMIPSIANIRGQGIMIFCYGFIGALWIIGVSWFCLVFGENKGQYKKY